MRNAETEDVDAALIAALKGAAGDDTAHDPIQQELLPGVWEKQNT